MTTQTPIEEALAAHEGTIKPEELTNSAARQLHKTMTKAELVDLARPKMIPKRFVGGQPTRTRERSR